jgi:hypothetical protein
MAKRTTKVTSDPAAPDLSSIIEQLRPLAVPIEDLVPDPANARKHGAENLTAIKASLRVYGQRKPVVVNKRNGVVEAGNGTLAAAIALKWTHVAAVYVDDDPSTAAGFAISDNRTAELAEWDDDALDSLMRTIESGDEDLQEMLASLAEDQGIIPPDEVDLPALEPTTRHTVIMAYTSEDIEDLCRFLGVDELPEQKMGKVLLERIKDSVASPAN